MVRKLLLTVPLLFVALSLLGQLPDPCPSNQEPPADNCSDACIYCDFNGISSSSAGYTPGAAPGFCGSIENEQWLGFIAGAGSATFTATPNGCANGNGIQIALYASCGGAGPIACNGGSQGGGNNPVSINAALTPGANYFLLIDGWAGDQCNFTITVTPPAAVQAPPIGSTIGNITGPSPLCPGATATYTVPPVTNAGGYTWTVPPGWLVNGDPGPLTVIAPGGNTVQITAGPNVGSNFQICVQAANSCYPDGPSRCRTISVQNIPPTILQPAVICFEDAPYTLPWGDEALTSGTYQTVMQSYLGCDSIVRQNVTVKPALITFLPTRTICKNQCTTVCGEQLCDAGNYSISCQSFQGCDSTINVGVQVLDPVADILGNLVLTCNTTSTVLTAAPSPPVTIFTWRNANGQIIGNGPTYTATAAGTYILQATMTGGGIQCTAADTVIVTGNTVPPTLSALGGTVTCASPTVQLNASSNAGNPTWAWAGPNGFMSNIQNPTALESGVYTVTVTSGTTGCSATATATVSGDTNPPSLAATGTTLTCATPTAPINVNSTPAGSAFSWAGPNGFTANVQSPNVSEAGTYTVTVTSSANGCTSTATTSVALDNAPPGANAAANGTITCPTPTVVLSGGPGTAGNSFAWVGPNFSSAIQNPTVDTAGTYTLTVTGSNGCTSTATTVVTGDTNPPDAGAQGGTLDCDTQVIGISGTSSASSPSFAWAGPNGYTSSQQNPNDVTVPGIYTLTVTALNNCTMTATATVLGDFAAPDVSASGGVITCAQSSVSIDGSSTTPGATLHWDGPGGFTSTLPSVVVNTVGDYILTATAPNGCTSTAVAAVTPDANIPNASAQGGTLSCAVTSIVLNGNSTTPNAELLWTGPNGFSSTLEDPTITVEGIYVLTVTNPVNGCTAQASAFVDLDDAQPGATADGGTVTCAAPSLSLIASSPTPGVTYAWSGPNGFTSAQQNPTASVAGTYTVVITDPSNGCTSSDTADIVADQTNPSASATTGTLTCTLTDLVLNGNATLPSSYAWSGPNFSSALQNPTVTAPGDYTLVVTAANGCTGSVTVTVDQDIVPPGATANGNTIDCNNPQVGISAGTTAGISFEWVGPNNFSSNLQSPTVAEGGTYTVTTTGANGCTSTATALVDLDLVTASISAVATDILTCTATTINIQTGITTSTSAVQSIAWTGPNGYTSIDEDPLVADPGVYTIVVTTVNGCTATASVTVNQNIVPPTVGAQGGTLTCTVTSFNLDGSSNTSAPIYAWTGPNNFSSSLEDPLVTEQGTYVLTVTAPNGCTSSAVALVNADVAPPGANATSSNNLDCDDLNTTLTASSQASGVSYLWSGPNNFTASTATATASAPGVYQVLVTGANGCTSTSSVSVSQDLNPPTASATGGTIDCISGQTALAGSSTTQNVTYFWTGPNNFQSNQQNPTVSQDGQYLLTVTGPNGCTATASATVLENTLSPQVSLSGGGTVTCAVQDVTITGTINTPGATGVWTGPNNFTSQQASVTVSVPGTYTYTVTAQNGCISAPTSTVLIDVQPPQGITAAGGQIDCNSPSINLASGSTTQGVQYAWSGPGNFSSNLPNPAVTNAGTYTVVITNPVNGCNTSTSVVVTLDPTVPNLAVSADSLTCTQTSVVLSTTSSVADATFAWTGPNGFTSSQQSPSVSTPGAYQVVATANSSGCTATFNYTVTQNVNPPGVTAQGTTLTCTLTSGQITSNSNAVGATYAWTGPGGFTSNLQSPTVTLTGTYTVVATGTNGCTSSAQVQVQPDANAPVVSAVGGTVSCAITSITLSASANVSVTWQWAGPGNFSSTSPNPTVSAPGNYTVSATAANGCVTSQGVTVNADTQSPSVSIATPQQLDCTTKQVGLVGSVQGTGTFSYQWSTANGNIVSGANGLNPTVSQAGQYQLLVTNNSNGCTATQVQTVVSNDDTPNAANIQARPVKCFGDTNGSANVLGVTGGTPPYLYSIDNKPFVPNPLFTSLAPGTYNLVIQDANGCELETSFQITEPEELIVNLGPDTTIHLGDWVSITLDNIVNYPNRVQTTQILPADLPLNEDFQPKYSIRYKVTMIDSSGCKASDERLVIVDRTRWVYIPNVINPNSIDNNNIVTVFGGPDVVGIKSFLIYDRWGDNVHEVRNFAKNDPTKGWDGTFKGQPVNPAVYVYFAEVEFLDGEVVLFKGDITVVR